MLLTEFLAHVFRLIFCGRFGYQNRCFADLMRSSVASIHYGMFWLLTGHFCNLLERWFQCMPVKFISEAQGAHNNAADGLCNRCLIAKLIFLMLLSFRNEVVGYYWTALIQS